MCSLFSRPSNNGMDDSLCEDRPSGQPGREVSNEAPVSSLSGLLSLSHSLLELPQACELFPDLLCLASLSVEHVSVVDSIISKTLGGLVPSA